MVYQLCGCEDLLQVVKTDEAPIPGPYLHPVSGEEGKQHLHRQVCLTHYHEGDVTGQHGYLCNAGVLPFYSGISFLFFVLFLLLPACFCVVPCIMTLEPFYSILPTTPPCCPHHSLCECLITQLLRSTSTP